MWTSEEKRSGRETVVHVCVHVYNIYIYVCVCVRSGRWQIRRTCADIHIYGIRRRVLINARWQYRVYRQVCFFFFFVDYGRENCDRMHRSVALYSPVRFPLVFSPLALRFFCPTMIFFLPAEYPRLQDNRVRIAVNIASPLWSARPGGGCRRKNVVRSERERDWQSADRPSCCRENGNRYRIQGLWSPILN